MANAASGQMSLMWGIFSPVGGGELGLYNRIPEKSCDAQS